MSGREGGSESESPRIGFRQWAGPEDFAAGTFDGTVASADALRLDRPLGVVEYTDPFADGGAVLYETGSWFSPVVAVPAGFDELVGSWNARTPQGTWLEVSVRVWAPGVDASSDAETFVIGRWAKGVETIHRTSVPGQSSDLAHVDCDVVVAAAGTRLGAWQLAVSLRRVIGSRSTPTLTMVGAMTSLSARSESRVEWVPARAQQTGAGVALAVPCYSQMVHRGRFPEYDNGGEAWCSPASTAMLLGYWKRRPDPSEYLWVGESYPDPVVAHAAAGTFDYAYDGAGNWSFNAAYAATFGLSASVTRLRSMAEAESFLAAGVPLVASVSFSRDELAGAGYATAGHLLVLAGFTPSGDVVVNDPASHHVASNDDVRVVYDRSEFGRVWLRGSGGLVYVIRPHGVALPPAPPGTDVHW